MRTDHTPGPGGNGLCVEVAERGSTVVMSIIGEARVWDGSVLDAAVSRSLFARARRIVVDLSMCTMLSSVAVARIIEMSQIACRSGRVVVLSSARPEVLEIIRLLRLEQLVPVVGSLDGAVATVPRRESA